VPEDKADVEEGPASAAGPDQTSEEPDEDPTTASKDDDGGESSGSTGAKGNGNGNGASDQSDDRSSEDDDGQDEPVDEVAEKVEDDLDDLTTATNERDEFKDHLLRLQADFDNYRKRVQKELGEAGDKALKFVEELLPVLDAVDAARAHGANEVDQVAGLLVDLLAKQGLERVGADGDVFDPTLHDAVMHETGDDDVQTVAQVLRAGWRWRGRVLRPAMVKVIGG
jgi:molecular chaperone GrpE